MIRADAAGSHLEPRSFDWTGRDTLLYALGIGAGTTDLPFVTENSHDVPQRVFPTFGVIVADPSPALTLVGDLDLGMLVHGAQRVQVYEPLGPTGSVEVISAVSEVWDKGVGGNAILTLTGRAIDRRTGRTVVETTSTVIVRKGGGFGGEPGRPSLRESLPEHTPDAEVTARTRADQALLYRLSGDRNPLHSDPWFARERAGFPAPILHGLCTYGVAGRALLGTLCADDPTRFLGMSARFSAPAFPGEILRTQIWRVRPGHARFRTWADGTAASPARIVLDGGLADYLTP